MYLCMYLNGTNFGLFGAPGLGSKVSKYRECWHFLRRNRNSGFLGRYLVFGTRILRASPCIPQRPRILPLHGYRTTGRRTIASCVSRANESSVSCVAWLTLEKLFVLARKAGGQWLERRANSRVILVPWKIVYKDIFIHAIRA